MSIFAPIVQGWTSVVISSCAQQSNLLWIDVNLYFLGYLNMWICQSAHMSKKIVTFIKHLNIWYTFTPKTTKVDIPQSIMNLLHVYIIDKYVYLLLMIVFAVYIFCWPVPMIVFLMEGICYPDLQVTSTACQISISSIVMVKQTNFCPWIQIFLNQLQQ